MASFSAAASAVWASSYESRVFWHSVYAFRCALFLRLLDHHAMPPAMSAITSTPTTMPAMSFVWLLPPPFAE